MEILSLLPVLDTSTFLLCLSVCLTCFWFVSTRLPRQFPPGPGPLPVLGNLLLFKDPCKAHQILAQLTWSGKYGPLVGLKIGSHPTIVINQIDALKETLIDNGENFSGRPRFMSLLNSAYHKDGQPRGMFLTDGPIMKASRRLALLYMKQFGLDKSLMEKAIQEEARILCGEITKDASSPQDVRFLFNLATSNIICSVDFGTRFDYKNKEFKDLVRNVNEIFSSPLLTSPLNYFPMLQFATPKSWTSKGKTNMDSIRNFIHKQMDHHKKTFDAKNLRDFIDVYLDMEQKGESTDISLEDMEQIIVEMFTGGTETTSTLLQWLLLYMIREPEIQERCQQEVDSVVGSSRDPSLSDKADMPYVMATLHETMRHSTIGPLGAPHATLNDVTVSGYHIPKGTLVLTNIYAIHNDPQQWSDPSQYQPERWLDSDGQFQKRESFALFSVGPRVCPGENLSRNEIFLFFCFLLQRLTFHPVDANSPPSLDPRPTGGLAYAPQPYQLIAKSR